MANNGKAHKAKWTVMIYMAVDDAKGMTEAKMFLDELAEIRDIIPALKPNETEHRDLRILLQAYTNWNDETGQPGEFRPKRFEVDANFDSNKPLELENVDFEKISMGNSKALSKFIVWCKETAKAENYMLFLWGHGTGSSMFSLDDSFNNMLKRYPSLTLTDTETGRRIRSIDELTGKNNMFDKNNKNKIKLRINIEGSNLYGPSLNVTVTKRQTEFFEEAGAVTLYDLVTEGDPKTPISPEAERLKKYLSTRSNLDALLEKEIRESLKSHPEINLLVIVGCCMQTIEFGFELKKDKKLKETDPKKSFYYVASEELIFFNGYNYSDSFKALANYPEMDARTLATRIVQDTALKKTYSDYQKQSFAISCVDLQESDEMAGYIHEFASAIVYKYKDNKYIWDKIKEARKQCRHFGEEAYTFSFVDITWFFKRFHRLMMNNGKYEDELRKLVEKIISFLQEKYVVNNWIGSGRTPSFQYERSYGGHGVAIYFPSSKEAHLNNKDLGKFFFTGSQINPDGSSINGDPNEFTLKNNWNKLIVEFMNRNPEGNEDPVQDPVDEERKKLLEENSDLKNIVANLLLEVDIIKTGVVADLSMKNGASTS